ncbi:MAG: hypothetical protein K6D92_05650 [Erysipelotrichaceae bacterium]|jgi:prolyl-tRNA editing enzyme YbaK/EbsC (Cys-tRNA(Pro) deacylase)|nr:hypothetical protein [Erysipelotrichaceae bacterium]
MPIVFQNIDAARDLLPESVYRCLKTVDPEGTARVGEIDPACADGESLHQVYGVPYEKELNCLVVAGSRGDETNYAALLVPYGKRASMNSVVRTPLNAKKVVFADLEYVIQETGMEFGSITPVGLPEGWKILAEETILEQETVIIGGGKVCSKLEIPTSLLKKLPGFVAVKGLAKE